MVARDQDHRGHEAVDDRCPRHNHGASDDDRCEPAEQAVADVGHVPVVGEDSLAEESGESGGAPDESCGHGGPTHDAPLVVVAIGAVGAKDLGEDLGLNPYQPNQRWKVPRTTRDVL